MLSFNDTAIAFSGKTDNDLRRSYWLFKLVGNSNLVKIGQKLTTFAINTHLPIRSFIKATIFRQFCGGENITECLKTIEALGKYNVGSILDYSVEGKAEESVFDQTAQEIIETLDLAKQNKHIPFAVFKPTGLGDINLMEKVTANAKLSTEEQKAWERVIARFDSICSKAHDIKVKLLIDAEESWIQNAVDGLAQNMMAKYNKEQCIVFNTAQMYRNDRLIYLENALNDAKEKKYYFGVKVVRGAYMEKERARATKMGYASPINNTKTETDAEYNAALEFCIKNIEFVSLCAGTHNEDSAMLLVKLLKQNNIPVNHPHVWFSQLLGMSDHISFNIANAGYNVAKYVPYGPVRDVLPYLIRRAMENTSVKGQTGRELSLIIKEKQRRAASKN
jgi:proline dehydrogenase